MSTPWLASWVGAFGARVRLFCLPPAGGGPMFYATWRRAIGPDIQVCPVVLPGHEMRAAEPPIRRMAELVPPLAEALAPYAERPYALFGHSLGSVVAYELSRALLGLGAAPPACLLASGRVPPHLLRDQQPVHRLPDDEFLAAMARLGGIPDEVIADPELTAFFLPVLRADVELDETYEPLPGRRPAFPVYGFVGRDDGLVDAAEMRRWAEVTEGPFALRLFEGGHFYLKDDETGFLAEVRTALAHAVVGR